MKRKIKMIGVILGVMILTSIASVYAVQAVNSIDVSYDNTTSKLTSTNVKGAIDELYTTCSKGIPVYLNKYLRSLASSSTILPEDESGDANMRYIGANPSNFVSFNGELWRIIGVFNENSHGKVGMDLVKIQANNVLEKDGKSTIAWNDVNENDWSNATLQQYLNTGDYYTNTLSSTSKSMIQTVDWKIGGSVWAEINQKAIALYNFERGDTGARSVPTLTSWNGDIALAYVSDYLFSTNGGSTYDRNTCINQSSRTESTNLYWNTAINPPSECAAGSWMSMIAVNSGLTIWTLNTRSNTYNYAYRMLPSNAAGITGANIPNRTDTSVFPTVYLKSNIICTNCGNKSAGTETNPFELSIG